MSSQKMNQEFLACLPSEIIIDIFARLPVQDIIRCKCVRRSWLYLINTQEFVKYHLSKSAPTLVVHQCELDWDSFSLFNFKDEPEPDHHELHYQPITKFDLIELISPPFNVGLEGSANGLLFLRQINSGPEELYLCNPITREYITILSPERIKRYYPSVVTYGFGVSKTTGQHKVVRIFHDCKLDPDTQKVLSVCSLECKVYTLETGMWKSISTGAPLYYSCRSNGVLLNGNLHWLVNNLQGSYFISCLDLERELFTTISCPGPPPGSQRFLGGLVALEGSLCLCDNTSETEIVIWIMKEYGVENSWSKDFVISKIPNHAGETYEVVYPLKIFKDGDVLMCWWDFHLFYYSHKTKTTESTDMFALQNPSRLDARLHTPTFLSLKNLAKENVISF